jgi:hypothetical protein
VAGTFTARVDQLIAQAEGKWSARCEVNQIYAHYQEVHPEFNHPDGGQAFYLRDTVYLGDWLSKMTPHIIDEFGLGLDVALRNVAEGMARGVYRRAPVEFRDLRRSGHPYVLRDDVVVWDRPPDVKRLDDKELRTKRHLSYLFDPHRYSTRRFR